MITIHYFDEVKSTMDIARQMAEKECPEFTVVCAKKQTNGRGRLKRVWISESGGLYFTVILRPNVDISYAYLFNFATSLSIIYTFEELFAIKAWVKWPNDIFLNNEKIAGILSELSTDDKKIKYLNIGIGLNINYAPHIEKQKAGFLEKSVNKKIDKKKILNLFLKKFKKITNNININSIMDNWRKHSITLNKRIKVVIKDTEFYGISRGVEDDGSLLLELPNGDVKKIVYGDCFL